MTSDKIPLTKELVTSFIEKNINALGYNLPESCYQNALDYELRNHLFKVEQEPIIDIVYGLIRVGQVKADLIVDDKYIIEMKVTDKIKNKHRSQLEKYLRLKNYKKGFLINISFDKYEIEEIGSDQITT